MLNTMTGTVRLRVSLLLKERNMTVAELAKRTGMSHNTALALSRDAYDRIGKETIARLCDVLGVEPGALFSYDPETVQE
jgi:putative transcriptional regulator